MSIDGRLFFLCIIAAFGAGAATSVMTISASARESGPAPVSVAPLMEEQISQIASSVKALEDNLRQLRSRLEEDRGPSDASAVQREVVRQESKPVAASPGRNSQRREHPAHWVAILHKDISRVLVERGLTPFDSRMGNHVKEASNAVRKVKTEYGSRIAVYHNQVMNGTLSSGDYNKTITPIMKERGIMLKIIIDRLADAMDSLREDRAKD